MREWLANQAAGGYVEYDSDSEKYYLSEEQALCLANPNGPMDLPGGYSVVEDLFHVKAPGRGELPQRRWDGMGGARSVSVPGHRAVLPGRL